MASLVLLLSLVAVILSTTVSAEDMTIFSMAHVPDWQMKSKMVLSISAPEADAVAIQFELYPLTSSVGLNGSDTSRMSIQIRGPLVSLDTDEFNVTTRGYSNSIVSLNCDSANSTVEIRELTRSRDKFPLAILLYSLAGDCCGIRGSNLAYTSIFTMANPSEAQEMLNYTQTGTGKATINGNPNNTTPDSQNGQSGSNSAVAMSILYSITGLITLLFLVIIATGAIRAHRYPERYGPRSGHGGRPRQSRAKGIARAVLETIPIVKFGDPNPPKPDPALELEHQPSRSSHDPATGTRLSAISEEVQTPRIRLPENVPPTIAETPSEHATTDAGCNPSTTNVNAVTHGPDEEHLGCSICTEDFTVGEDVRVLPCDHKFHPHCIDPWLINISGTCPLCRLDLRPPCKEGAPPSSGSSSSDDQHLPPLAGYADENRQQGTTTSSNNQRRRSSRLLDLHRLRHASVEERIEILRLHRTQSQQYQRQQAQAQAQAQIGGENTEGRGAKLADRLRDKFRIRTTRRGESPGRGGTDRGAAGSGSTA